MEKKQGYIAGALFKMGDQIQRITEKDILTTEVGSVEWFNPLTDNEANDKSKLPTAQSIFDGDTEKIIDSDYIVAELDGEDAGVMMELGIAYGLNFMRNIMIGLLKQGLSPTDIINGILNNVPHKEVYAHLTDIRVGTAGEYDGVKVPFGINQYVVGGVEQMGSIYTNFDELILDLKKNTQE